MARKNSGSDSVSNLCLLILNLVLGINSGIDFVQERRREANEHRAIVTEVLELDKSGKSQRSLKELYDFLINEGIDLNDYAGRKLQFFYGGGGINIYYLEDGRPVEVGNIPYKNLEQLAERDIKGLNR